MLKTSRDWTPEEGGRSDKIRSGPIARVGVHRRRRVRRCLSFKGVLRMARSANSHAEQRAKTKCRRDGGKRNKTWPIPQLTHVPAHICHEPLTHPPGFLK